METTPAELELRRQHLVGRDVPCERCGYNLRDLNTDRCPECGRLIPFPPDEARIAAEVSAYLRDRDLYCKHCRTNLRGMATNHCPTCGTSYMLAGGIVRQGYRARRARWMVAGSVWLALLTLVGVFAGVGGGVRAASQLTSNPVGAPRTFLGAVLCFSVGILALGWSRRVRALYLDERRVSQYETFAVHLVAAALLYSGLVLSAR